MPLDRENSATLFDCQHELAAAYLASQVGRLRLFVPTSPAYSLVCHDERTAVREGSALRRCPQLSEGCSAIVGHRPAKSAGTGHAPSDFRIWRNIGRATRRSFLREGNAMLLPSPPRKGSQHTDCQHRNRRGLRYRRLKEALARIEIRRTRNEGRVRDASRIKLVS